MPTTEKVLWVVNYNTVAEFVKQAKAAKVTAVAIRTDNDVKTAIEKFHDQGIKVYGWRWPSAKRDPALREAEKVVQLLGNGLDGYYVDPEGDKGKPWNWDQSGLEGLADEFSKRITSADSTKPFGITSHYLGQKVYGKLPWTSFFKYATIFLPQAYWRSEEGAIGHGKPRGNYKDSLATWQDTGAPAENIVPMAGEIAHATAAEIDEYAAVATDSHIPSLHFYASEDGIGKDVWKAIARAQPPK
jgi:hypothetical protein